MDAIETPMIQYDFGNAEMEDIDLVPTYDDWLLVYNYFTNYGALFPRATGFDAENMLCSYYTKPAGFRRLFQASTEGSESLGFDSITGPIDHVQPNLQIRDSFQHIEELFAFKSMDLAIELQLHIDPDDSPWLCHLSARQREERRRVFWYTFRAYAMVRALSSNPMHSSTVTENVKYPYSICDPFPIFSNADHPIGSQLWNLIGRVKQHWALPPPHIHDLFTSLLNTNLLNQLKHLQESAPITHLFFFEHPQCISSSDRDRFMSQTMAIGSELCSLNLAYHTTNSVFFRPILFATALPSCRPTRLSVSNRDFVIQVLNKCVDAAWRSLSIFQFAHYLIHGEDTSHLQKHDATFFDVFYMSIYDAFEGMICLWFVACHMDSEWRPYLPLGDYNSRHERKHLECLIALYMEENETIGNANGLAVAKLMAEMLEDMKAVADTQRKQETKANNDQVIGCFDTEKNAEPVHNLKEVRCFLGLLGLDIGKTIRIDGRTEDSWRLFWKLYA
ncbi:hypothetical protein BCR33DRAFT_737541 [Rhizoclosmatium globosum]|uniref:Transcription factor domain-containing protein n=1 Tax=Rhizoclosmatium globosum TaxID=329046 RepID=A0A1Y2CE44_9FUNG|nr:hypothetical protein BCR33DRAFT_737541 [Rhizoclosmatium globosum]|eukprot:ORY45157.1 hypothetical protein BCR33DRAFT_737541 [Rhizoclosmatium globosum]